MHFQIHSGPSGKKKERILHFVENSFVHAESSHQLICRWHIMQRMTFSISFNYSPCKRNLFANHKNKCLSLPSSTSGSPPYTTYIFTWVTRKIKEHYVVYTCKINPPGCSARYCGTAPNYFQVIFLLISCMMKMNIVKENLNSKLAHLKRKSRIKETTIIPVSAHQE